MVGVESVLIIQCSDDHMLHLDGLPNTGKAGPLINGILDVVKNELKLDHYYIAQNKMILVRIDANTLENSILNDFWRII